MLGSITPLGERGRRQRWWLTATAHAMGSLAGGAAVGAVLGGTGALVSAVTGGRSLAVALLGVGALVGLAVDARTRSTGLPGLHRQVDETWLTTYRGWVYGGGFGVQLGAAVLTIVPTTTTYVALLAAALTASPAGGALVGASYGLGRAVPLLLTARVRTAAALGALQRRLQRTRRPAFRAVTTGHAAVAVTALVLALGPLR